MKRRAFLASIPALAAIPFVAQAAPPPPTPMTTFEGGLPSRPLTEEMMRKACDAIFRELPRGPELYVNRDVFERIYG
jgi:hypothetical protein